MLDWIATSHSVGFAMTVIVIPNKKGNKNASSPQRFYAMISPYERANPQPDSRFI